jgi:hypothetical protein
VPSEFGRAARPIGAGGTLASGGIRRMALMAQLACLKKGDAIAAPGHVMRNAGEDGTSQPRHAFSLAAGVGKGKRPLFS